MATIFDLKTACVKANNTCHDIEDFWEDLNIIPCDIVCEICDLIMTIEEHMDNGYKTPNMEKAIADVLGLEENLVKGHEKMKKTYGVE